ncbi:hypothetical protein LTR36_002874 [Oleoguttula mirabilis]|uniref:Uncharacterized protein n=1 Tax=Oleoguttula mirabilis TaxID=1507867 RepID=A0AAV9JJC7_9PEZI|nr:hypothetical protein LTR36_002874 [Oleoguttula mirabilis]
MCNGEGVRQSHGGAIAVLKPSTVAGAPDLAHELRLRLAEDDSNKGTTASLEGLKLDAGTAHIVIHGHGDLRSVHDLGEAVLHQFKIPDSMAGASFPLANRLSLSVGGDGVIGRRASFVQDGLVVGVGIIGWN